MFYEYHSALGGIRITINADDDLNTNESNG